MGIYMYSIRAKTHKIMLPDGRVETAAEMRFLFNGGSFFTPRASDHVLKARCAQYWAGKMLPKYVVRVGEKGPEGGDWVHSWTGQGPFWIDCDVFPGEQIGEVLEVKRGIGLRVGPHGCKPFGDFADPETGQDVCTCGSRLGPERWDRTLVFKEQQAQEARDKAAKEEEARLNWQSFISE